MNHYQRPRGFTLTEIAVVLVIISLLIGGMLVPLSAQQDSRYYTETQKTLDEIKDALTGYAIANGRLPCPALATTTTGTAEAATSAGCTNQAGVLPWATLGVKEVDAWGNRFTYRVSAEYARTATGQTTFTSGCIPDTTPAASAFALCSSGDMTIRSTAGGTILANTIPAVVISHGKNANGAYTNQGTQLDSGSDADELDNQLTGGGTATANTDFVSKTPTPTFDDLIIWLSPNVIANRMLSAGKLP